MNKVEAGKSQYVWTIDEIVGWSPDPNKQTRQHALLQAAVVLSQSCSYSDAVDRAYEMLEQIEKREQGIKA